MTKRARYLLITVCVAAFFVLAPFVILYVRGVTYDRDKGRYLSTGLLSVRTDPRDVQVYLNNELTDTTPADIRFLKTAGYNVRLEKSGYRPWSKRIEVTAGKVSWASPGVEKIILFFESSQSSAIAENVVDFAKLPTGWLYLTPKTLELSLADSGANPKSFVLPKTVNKITTQSSGRFFLLTGGQTTLLFSSATGSFTDLTPIFKNVTAHSFDSNGNLWLLKAGQLVMFDIATRQQTAIAKDVSAFYMLGDTAYYLQKNAEGKNVLFLLTAPYAQSSPQTIAEVPAGAKTELGVTAQKEIFVLADSELYRINEPSQKLKEGVTAWFFDGPGRSLLYTTASELEFYNFIHNRIQLINRSTSGFTNPYLNTALGYVFYGQNGQVTATELDTFDHQNTYTLLAIGDGAKFLVSHDAKEIYSLDKGSLKNSQIR